MESWSFQVVRRNAPEYEKARCSSVWNGHVPDRYPELIVYPETDQDVQAIVLYAKENNMSIGTKSGGHSWTASFLRDGGIMVDMVRMNKFTFDVESKTSEVQPAAYGSDLNASLATEDLIFPGGHCPTVGLGGFLLQGGFGWNSRKWGLACESVLAIDVVDADGSLLHADSKQNSDFYWAARGAGCGYFGLITRFYLKLYPLPKGIMTARYIFERDSFHEVTLAVERVSDQLSMDVEIGIFIARDQDGFNGRCTVALTLDALSDTPEEAQRALSVIHDLPVVQNKSIKSYPYVACTLKEMLQRFDDILDNKGRRYETNNMWTDAPVENLLGSMDEIIDNLPEAPSHLYLLWWLPVRDRPDMAFSMEAKLYIALYAISTDRASDAPNCKYIVDSLSRMEPFRKGIQLADENLPSHPGKFMRTQNYVRLEKLRQKHDPHGRFYTYMRLPVEFTTSLASL